MIKKSFIFFVYISILLVLIGGIKGYFFFPDLKAIGEVVAYRGGGSQLDYEKLNITGCAAVSLDKSGISTVENTLQSVAASVNAGAEIIHLNVHRTDDDQLVVFHDWTLDCATDGIGVTSELPYEELGKLNAGYGYTFDDGRTFPFREDGFVISKLEEFYDRFPSYEFWLNIKTSDERTFAILYAFISERPNSSLIITNSEGTDLLKKKNPQLRVISKESVKQCGIDYLKVGWAGFVPNSCKNTILMIPPSKAKYFWGYPQVLASRMKSYNTKVYLWGKHSQMDPLNVRVIESGIGIVTGDIQIIRVANANKRVN